MPCRDYPDTNTVARSTYDYERAKLDEVTQMLCVMCNTMETLKIDIPDTVAPWWTQHKAEDMRRAALEEAEATRKRQVRAALKKLTKEERKLLGISRKIEKS